MKKAIFLDRDGVINRDPGGWTKYSYVTKTGEFIFIDGSINAIKKLNEAGYRICLVSNQGGISKGYFTRDDLEEVNRYMLAEIERAGGKIDELYYCPHQDNDNCACRKPKTGLIEQALGKSGADLKDTFMIGDSIRDIEAGKKMGMKTIFLLSGKEPASDMKNWDTRPDSVKNNLLEAVEWILKGEKAKNGE